MLSRRLPWLIASSHAICVLVFVINAHIHRDNEWSTVLVIMGWATIDFPVGFIAVILYNKFTMNDFLLIWVVMPVVFGVFGSIQWYCVIKYAILGGKQVLGPENGTGPNAINLSDRRLDADDDENNEERNDP